MRQRLPLFSLLPLLLLLSACASLGIAPAKSLSDRLAYGYGVHTAVLQTATMELQSGVLSAEDAEAVLKLGDESRALLDAARGLMSTGDNAGADRKLVLATAILTQLQTYLRSKQ